MEPRHLKKCSQVTLMHSQDWHCFGVPQFQNMPIVKIKRKLSWDSPSLENLLSFILIHVCGPILFSKYVWSSRCRGEWDCIIHFKEYYTFVFLIWLYLILSSFNSRSTSEKILCTVCIFKKINYFKYQLSWHSNILIWWEFFIHTDNRKVALKFCTVLAVSYVTNIKTVK